MKSATFIFFSLILLLILYLAIERIIHRITLSKFKIRIHVNGTRGKSSITRLIRSGLAESGLRVLAKTTGTMARLIFPDHSERVIRRWGRPSILEQISILNVAKRENAEVIVIECMALEPRYQWSSEAMILKSHIGVISNVREDHLDVMGPTIKDVTLSLASGIPYHADLFCGKVSHPEIFESVCKERKTTLHLTDRNGDDKLTEKDMNQFTYWEHKENVSLALAVCEFLGVKREVALKGMWKSAPDPGALYPLTISFFGKNLVYLNAMAANDSESTRMIWKSCNKRYGHDRSAYVLFNCREDRLERSELIAKEIAQWENVEAIFLIGSGTKYALHFLKLYCQDGMQLFNWESADLDHIFESILEQVKEKSYVIALGNIAGIGLELNQYLKNRTIY
ncbi:MAG: poly-gamma-glutamate synthase PgsB [Leptospira sp.]|nr:poly-gamma-glutamate synthase PgsB [Leptospira sp.]